MLESRRIEFEKELSKIGFTKSEAETDVNASINRLIYYAGRKDKYLQVFGSINPVASAHFNFSLLEPTGVVGILAAEHSPLLGFISMVAPIIAGRNTCLVLASDSYPLPSITFSEVLNSSDISNGVVNMSWKTEELAEHFASHMDVNALSYSDNLAPSKKTIDELAENIKR